MMLTERCKCGGEIEIRWDGEGKYQREREPERARKEFENWRRRHKECLTRLWTPVYRQELGAATAPATWPWPKPGENVCVNPVEEAK